MVCPTQWFLEREAGASVARAHQSANLGQLVHALAQRVAQGELSAGPDDVDELMEHIDHVWDRLEFRTPWSKRREHERVAGGAGEVPRLAPRPTRAACSAVEEPFATVVEIEGEQVQLTGYADRLELDAEGNVVVVDLKTSRTAPSGPQVKVTRRSSASTSSPSTAAQSTSWCRRAARPLPAVPSWCSSGSRTASPMRRCSARSPSPTTVRSGSGSAAEIGQGGGPAARRELPGGRRRPLPRLLVRAHLPDQERGLGDRPMTRRPPREGAAEDRLAGRPPAGDAHVVRRRAPSSGRRSPRRCLPAVVIAGAGSGKTTLMAARVVYLVVTGQVRPDQVLGLTFTTKAASELRRKVREALRHGRGAGLADRPRRRGGARADGR